MWKENKSPGVYGEDDIPSGPLAQPTVLKGTLLRLSRSTFVEEVVVPKHASEG